MRQNAGHFRVTADSHELWCLPFDVCFCVLLGVVVVGVEVAIGTLARTKASNVLCGTSSAAAAAIVELSR